MEALQREARPFEDMSDEAQAARRALPFLEWCRTYLPHYFREPFAPFHGRMADAVGEPGMRTFICAFRGAGKSVLLSMARPLYRALRREVPYVIFGSLVQRLAAQLMDFVRLELEHNERLRCDYGELRVEGSEEEWVVDLPKAAERNARGQWAVRWGSVKFQAFGTGMTPRGVRHGPHRPYEFVGDDLENAELARNPKREKNLWDWLTGAVLPALEPEVWTFTVSGTMFGPDCMLETARRAAAVRDPAGRPLAKFFRQAAVDEGGVSVWPERFSQAALERMRAMQGLRVWNREYLLVADDPDKPFQPDWFRLVDAERPPDLKVACYLDPAHSLAPSGCPRALVAIGADGTGMRHVLGAWIERGTPAQMIEQLRRFHKQFRPHVIGIEINGGYALIRPLLATYEAKWGYRLPVRYVTETTNKDERIQALSPEMESGRWAWPARPSAGVQALQGQFLSYPDGYVDGPDACAGAGRFLGDAWRGRTEGPLHKTLTSRRDLAGVL